MGPRSALGTDARAGAIVDAYGSGRNWRSPDHPDLRIARALHHAAIRLMALQQRRFRSETAAWPCLWGCEKPNRQLGCPSCSPGGPDPGDPYWANPGANSDSRASRTVAGNPRKLLLSNDFPVEPPRGFEPRTYALRVRCSTTELRRRASHVVPCGLRRKPAHATRSPRPPTHACASGRAAPVRG